VTASAFHRPACKQLILSAAVAAWGLALAISVSTLWVADPPPGQLPSYMTSKALDARGPMRSVLTLIVLPPLMVLLSRPLLRHAALTIERRWALTAVITSLVTALWPATADPGNLLLILFGPPLAAALFYAARGIELHLDARDALLLPSWVAIIVAAAGCFPRISAVTIGFIGAILLSALRIAMAHLHRTGRIAPPLTFILCALSLPLLVAARSSAQAMGVLAIALIVGSPFVLRIVPAPRPELLGPALRFVVYPLIAMALPFLNEAARSAPTPRVDLFEDGHSLTPAAEMMRGKRPWIDWVPLHGPIVDGGVDAIAMRLGAGDVGGVLRFRHRVEALTPVALYLVAFAAMGSAEAALLTLFLEAAMLITGTPWGFPVAAMAAAPPLRTLIPWLSLAASIGAVRLRRPALLAWAAAFDVVAGFASIEFAFYSGVVLLLAVAVLRGRRMRSLLFVAAGTIGATILAAFAFGPAAIVAYLPVTLREIAPLGGVYSGGFFSLPVAMEPVHRFPDLLAGIVNPRLVWILLWSGAAIGASTGFMRRLSPRSGAVWLCAVWSTLAAISYASRLHVYFMAITVIFFMALLHRLARVRAPAARAIAAAGLTALVLCAAPAATIERWAGAFGSVAGNWVAYTGVSRAGHALFDADNARKLAAAQAYVDRLPARTTFFDFSNMAGLYYFFDRRLPIRQLETPMYQTEHGQREVIARLESDQSVVAALMCFPNRGEADIDGIPSAVRAPLVFQYLREHFTPDYQSEGVVFWRRIR
jgi:hypothetical protein